MTATEKKDFRWEPDDLSEALEVLRRGGLILYPTDTIWGIGCDATRPESVERIYALKRRRAAKAMLSIVDTVAKIPPLVGEMPEVVYDLVELATEPLTVIYPGVRGLAPNLLAEDGSAGIRVVAEPFCRELCKRLKCPIVSTSANVSGEPAPRCFGEIAEEVIAGVDYVVRYRRGDTSPGVPSHIVKVGRGAEIEVIR